LIKLAQEVLDKYWKSKTLEQDILEIMTRFSNENTDRHRVSKAKFKAALGKAVAKKLPEILQTRIEKQLLDISKQLDEPINVGVEDNKLTEGVVVGVSLVSGVTAAIVTTLVSEITVVAVDAAWNREKVIKKTADKVPLNLRNSDVLENLNKKIEEIVMNY